MTREDALMAMNGATLIGVADKLGVKAACNKTRTALKEAKSNVIARILEAEAALAAQEPETETAQALETEATQETTADEGEQEPANEPETEDEATQESTAEDQAQEPAAPAEKPKKQKKEKAPTQEPAETAEAVAALGDIFDKLNDLYFDGLLPKAAIEVRRTAKAYDCCSVKKGDAEGEYTVEACAQIVGRPIAETAAGVLHAMVHLYCMETGIAETCQKGRYHNNKFKKECEDRGLAVAYDSANGFVHTTPSEIFSESLKNAGLDLDAQLAAIPAKKKGQERA